MTIDIQPYLSSICADGEYNELQHLYTPTDALSRQLQPAKKSRFRLDLQLKVQTVPPPQREGQTPDQEQIERFNVLDGLRKYAANHVLLVGRPGSGKSTALQRLLWEEAQTPLAKLDKIPVLVELRQYKTSTLDLIHNFLKRHKLNIEKTAIEKLLDENRLLLLFDGVNELPNETARQDLNTFRQNYPQISMIFTTRDIGVGGDLGIEKKLEMQPLTQTQMQQFVRAYLPDTGEEMLHQLGERWRELGETPLLLWMLCSIFYETRSLPNNLGEIFRKFTSIYDNKIKADVPVSKESRDRWTLLLSHLAFKMIQGKTPIYPQFYIDRDEAEDILTEFLVAKKFNEPRELAYSWLNDLLKHQLLEFIEFDNKLQIKFIHQQIQEYYAAEYVLKELPNISDAKLKRDYLNYLKWTEPLALMLALLDNEAQALRVVKLALEVDLMLGARLAGEVKTEYQEKTVNLVFNRELKLILKIHLLGVTRSKSAISILFSLLNHNLFSRNENCVIALAKIDSNIVINDLIKIVQTKKSWIIYEEYTDSDIFNLEIEKEEHEYIRRLAIKELGKVGTHLAINVLIKLLSEKRLSGNTINIHILAIEALGNINNEAVFDTLLQQSLESQSPYIRSISAKTLYNISGEELLSRIVPRLENKDAFVRARYAELLGNIGTKKVSYDLSQLLLDEDSFVSLSAAEALVKIGDDSSITYLIKALENEEFAIIYKACKILGELRNKAAITPLIKLLNHKDDAVRICAAQTLGEIGDSIAISALLEACKDVNFLQILPDILGKIGTEVAIPQLLRALENKSLSIPIKSYVHCSVVEALGKIGSKVAIPQLIEALLDEDETVRRHAAEALGNIGDKKVIPDLLKVLSDDKSDYVRWSVALALGKLGSDAAIDILIKNLKNNFNEEERWMSAEALEKVGSIALPSLFNCLLSVHENFILSEVLYVISSIQNDCNYYNYTIANYDTLLTTKFDIQEHEKYYNDARNTSHSIEEGNYMNLLIDTLNKLNKTMSETKVQMNFHAPISNSNVAGNVEGNQNNYLSTEKIAEAEKVIQQLLEQIEQNKPTPIDAEVIVNKAVDNYPILRDKPAIEQAVNRNRDIKIRLRRVVTAVGIETVKVIFAPAGILIEGIKAWLEPQ